MKTNEQSHIEQDLNRVLLLTNVISLTVAVLLLFIGLSYVVFNVESTSRLSTLLFIIAPVFFIPIILNKRGYHYSGRLILTTLLPLFILFVSLDSKLRAADISLINPVNYFDVRIALINAYIVPLILFRFENNNWFKAIIAILPGLIVLLFFDPIHNYFGAGYYQSGLVSHDYYFSANLFTAITIVFITFVILFLKYHVLKGDYRNIRENKRINYYLSELVELSNSPSINQGNVERAKVDIIQTAYRTLQVSRVSLWNYNNNEASLECEYLIENKQITQPDLELKESDYPNYFKALKTQQLIIARHAQSDNATSEFTESYLKPLNIESMMDAPFLSQGTLGGVICCEHKNEVKDWDAAQSLMLKALGDFLSYAIIVSDRIHQNKLLQEQNEEIVLINENLESMVKSRTSELKKKNEQLTEYAFINSHILRAPVARIGGLYNLFKMENQSKVNDFTTLDHMEGAISELEKITKDISKAIEDNQVLDRNRIAK